MNNLNAASGISWIQRGWQIFKQQPAELLSLFGFYFFVLMLIEQIPWVGAVVSFLLMPALSFAFFEGARRIRDKQRVNSRLLFTGLRPGVVKPLLNLGLVLVLTSVLAGVAFQWFDDGELFKYLEATKSPESKPPLPNGKIFQGFFAAMLVYAPVLMAMWLAGPLIVWQKMRVVKAMFYSFFACLKAWAALLVFGIVFFGLASVLSSTLITIVALLIGSQKVLMVVAFFFLIAVMTLLHCSFYPAYVDIFGEPEALPDDAANGLAP